MPRGERKSGGKRRVGLVGSSGGGTATLSRSAEDFLGQIRTHLLHFGVELVDVCFLSCTKGLDMAGPDCPAALWSCEARQAMPLRTGTLKDLNGAVRETDKRIAKAIEEGRIDALIVISCDPEGANQSSAKAAARSGIPVVGTGGTSIGKLMNMGANFASSYGGSVATTSRSKALSYAVGLAKYWGLPLLNSASATKPLSFHSLLDGCLPAFLTAAIFMALLRRVHLLGDLLGFSIGESGWLASLGHYSVRGLPGVVLGVACHQLSVSFGEIELIASLVAGGFLSSTEPATGKVVCGVFGGFLIPNISASLLFRFTMYGWPATATTILTSGLSGVGSGILCHSLSYLICPVFNLYIDTLNYGLENYGALLGLILGGLTVTASMHGYYHTILLPLILLEMEDGSMSFLGMLDMEALVLVCAGICCGVAVHPRSRPAEIQAAERALSINLRWGDYVEAAYPFMERDIYIMIAAHVGGAVGGALCGYYEAKGSAYVPCWSLLIIGENGIGCLLGMAAAFAIPFLTTLVRL